MKLIIQRVSEASVCVEGQEISSIGRGYLVLVGIGMEDTQKQADILAQKLVKLRVMGDSRGKMNLSVGDAGGELLVVSQFTLYGDTKAGNRPSFIAAARPERAEPLYEYLIEKLRTLEATVKTGAFGRDMQIAARLDGPVTIIMES